MKKISTEKIPTWALCYLFNDDPTGLTEEDIKDADNFCNSFHAKGALVFDIPNEDASPYFTSVPAFGLPTDVMDIDVYEP